MQAAHQLDTNRSRLIGEINGEINVLHDQFTHQNPNIWTESLVKHLKELQEINRQLEELKVNDDYNTFCCGPVKKVSIVIIALSFIAWGVVLAIAVYDLTNGEKEDEVTNIVKLIFSIGALFLTSVGVKILERMDDDRDKYKILSRVTKIETQNSYHFTTLLEAFERYKHYHNDESESEKTINKCLRCREKIQENDELNNIPKKEILASYMIQLLPDNHPLKEELRKLKDFAVSLIAFQDNESILLPAEEKSLDDIDSSPFKGEQVNRLIQWKTFSQTNTTTRLSQQKISLSDALGFYRFKWHRLESTLGGFHLEHLNIDGLSVNREGGSASVLNTSPTTTNNLELTEIIVSPDTPPITLNSQEDNNNKHSSTSSDTTTT